ncbi:amino acid ABC transporter permease [Halospeciosus flavus]|uniref:amino acid ABC transporter permease n=1 Tax=Halospeciosus flavus TaxID=3032283 RepID=UPI0036201225
MNALWLSVILTVVSITLGFPIAVVLAAARVYGEYSNWLALAYVELLRGTPLLAQLFVLYYGLPWIPAFFRNLSFVGQGIFPAQAVWVAIVGFILNSAAYQAEYIRGAIQSVDPGQLEAARSVGLSKVEGIRHVVLPQALRFAIPGWTNELVYLVKYSSLAAFITVPELFYQAQSFASETYHYTELFVLAGILYLGLVVTVSNLMSHVEARVAIPGLGASEGR